MDEDEIMESASEPGSPPGSPPRPPLGSLSRSQARSPPSALVHVEEEEEFGDKSQDGGQYVGG